MKVLSFCYLATEDTEVTEKKQENWNDGILEYCSILLCLFELCASVVNVLTKIK